MLLLCGDRGLNLLQLLCCRGSLLRGAQLLNRLQPLHRLLRSGLLRGGPLADPSGAVLAPVSVRLGNKQAVERSDGDKGAYAERKRNKNGQKPVRSIAPTLATNATHPTPRQPSRAYNLYRN